MLRFRGGLVFKAHILCVSLNSRLESNKEEKKKKKGRSPVCIRLRLLGVYLEGLIRSMVAVCFGFISRV